MECRNSSNVIYSCRHHVAFCPKYRRNVLVDGVDERFRQMAQEGGRRSFPSGSSR